MRPIAPYIGGKRNLAERIIELIGKIPHDLYAEPFVGMGGVFLRRPARARIEIINDLSADVANFFRVLQRHYNPLTDMLRWQLTTRADFDRLMATNPETLTDLERAARFLYLQRTAYGGKVHGRTFGTSRTGPARFDLTKLVPLLQEVHERLSQVLIERRSFEQFILQYDREGALFYIDPPYWGSETDYGKGQFARGDFALLAEILASIKGRFILSLNDVADIRRTFKGFRFRSVATNYSLNGAAQKTARELIITDG